MPKQRRPQTNAPKPTQHHKNRGRTRNITGSGSVGQRRGEGLGDGPVNNDGAATFRTTRATLQAMVDRERKTRRKQAQEK